MICSGIITLRSWLNWPSLLLCLLVFAYTSLGHAEELSRRAEDVPEILEQALKAATEVQNPLHRRWIIDGIATAYALVGYRDRALELARSQDTKNTDDTLIQISRVMVEQGQGLQAREIISHMTRPDSRAWALEQLARYHIAKEERAEAIERLKQALRSAEGIDFDFRRTAIMSRIAEAQAFLGEHKAADATLRRALQLAPTTSGTLAEDLQFIQVLEIQVRLRNERGAWETLDGLPAGSRKGIGVKQIAVALSKAGKTARALEIATTMEEGYLRDAALQEIAEAQAEAGDIDGAMQTAGIIRSDKFQKVVALGHIADTLIKDHDPMRAQSVLRQAVEATTQISDRADLLGALARRQAELGDREAASRNIAQAIRDLDRVPDKIFLDHPRLTIMQAQIQAGDLAGAEKLASTISSTDFQNRAYCEIADFKARADDIEGALRAAALSHGLDHGHILEMIAKIQANRGDTEGALDWVTTQTSPPDRALALLGVAEGLLNQGKSIPHCPKKPDYF